MKLLIRVFDRTDLVFFVDVVSRTLLTGLTDVEIDVLLDLHPNPSRSCGNSKSFGRLLSRRRNIVKMRKVL